ncbi:FAD-dependent oxidoreductase [Cellulomonas soli]|uniref:FAD-dependent oxidoreductase n=1 Tax=Cellulomonas soli TaxID=931535 RepID=UPI003F86946B
MSALAPVRVVVIGHGMVGARFVEDLHAYGGPGRFDVVVLGAEEYEPYNRVLLSEVVAGKVDVAAITLPRTARHERTRVLPGVGAVAVERQAQVVVDDCGVRHPYDVAVLATGARARVPDLVGFEEGLPAGVHALRTLDDAREVVAATVNARVAVVVGGGVLGLEVACGLARRGLAVTVVHGGRHVMDRQLDQGAGDVVQRSLAGLGVQVRTRARTEEAVLHDGRVVGVRLEGGEVLPADLLVLSAGTVPEVALARRAGLEVGRGVVVGADLATADPRVCAIGDCAQPPEGGTGLVAQGWDQARRLARRLAEHGRVVDGPSGGAFGAVDADSAVSEALPAAGTDVVRVKAAGLDLVSMGAGSDGGGRRVVLSDPDGGRHLEVVVADGRVVAATCVGAGAVAADLVAAYTRGTPAPADPAQLLLRPVGGAAVQATSPTLMPDRAVVCRCNGVTKGQLVQAWRGGVHDVEGVVAATRATTGCGGCTDAVCGIVDWLRRADPAADPASDPVSDPAAGTAAGTGADADRPQSVAEPSAAGT